MNGGAILENNKDQHIFKKNKEYYIISIYTIVTVIIIAIALKLIFNFSDAMENVKKFLSMLSPFFIGFFIAYILNPLIKAFDTSFLKKTCHLEKPKLRKLISILTIYLLVFGLITVCLVIIIPELYTSISSIYYGIQDNYDKFIQFWTNLDTKYPDLNLSYISTIVETNSQNIVKAIQSSISTILPIIYNTSISVISWTFNLIIAIMVSCYMLLDKNIMSINAKRLIYAVIPKDTADTFLQIVFDSNRIFGQYLVGKTIDSTIIGCLCFLFMNILGLKYSLLTSIIVGVTNMIPYFGPFIGAVPGAILCLTYDWRYCIVFCILILILQQFDGLYLGPKILGDSTGLRPIWIIFAITAGGWAAGVIGMFLGVPVVAVVAFLCDKFINYKLNQKGITTNDFLCDTQQIQSSGNTNDRSNKRPKKKLFNLKKSNTENK